MNGTKLLCAVAAWMVVCLSSPGRDDRGFDGQVRPVLDKHCFACHSGKKPNGDLALDSTSPDFGANGAAWNGVLEHLNDHTMPPKEKSQPSDSEVKTVKDWITSGLIA